MAVIRLSASIRKDLQKKLVALERDYYSIYNSRKVSSKSEIAEYILKNVATIKIKDNLTCLVKNQNISLEDCFDWAGHPIVTNLDHYEKLKEVNNKKSKFIQDCIDKVNFSEELDCLSFIKEAEKTLEEFKKSES